MRLICMGSELLLVCDAPSIYVPRLRCRQFIGKAMIVDLSDPIQISPYLHSAICACSFHHLAVGVRP